MRATSLQAYHQIRDEGLLSKTRFAVYEVLVLNGPLTMAQIHKVLSGSRSVSGGTYTSRLSELREMGVIQVAKRITCPVTGRRAILWEATGDLPVRYEKPRRTRCEHCKGKGHIIEAQGRLF